MCGICGIASRDSNYPIDLSVLLAMRDSLVNRGPDDAGYYLKPGIALGSRRLSILDLSERARMPMSTQDGRYRIVYNGEVYNYRELRTELKTRGYNFRSDSDTEVVLAMYVEYGSAMLERLNGMFAIAIWDERDRSLFLARDRVGVKPLYYASQGNSFYFASEEKALFAAGVSKEFDPDTWEELLCFRYVAGERTPYVGVKRLLPGHYLLWNTHRVQIKRWWNLSDRARQLTLPTHPAKWFQQTLDDAVGLRRISDVPVGVLLSGGLDSGSIAASLAKQAGSGVASFTVRFKEAGYDEGPLARQVADRWKLEHHELEVSGDQLLERLYEASRLNDEPLVHGNDLHLWAIAEYAKPFVTVLLSGEGGDETLGGYVRYQPLRHPALLKALRPAFPSAIRAFGFNGRMSKLARFLDLGSNALFVLFNSCDLLPGDLQSIGMRPGLSFPYRESVLAEAEGLYPNEPFRQALYSDHHTFLNSILDRNDRMTMGASIECRVPFLDYRLIERLAALPTSVLTGRKSKQLLRDAVGHRLPESVLRHRKWGFGVPWDAYFRQVPELRALVQALPELDPIRHGPFRQVLIKHAVRSFLEGDQGYSLLVRQLVMITIWYQACFKQVSFLESDDVSADRLAVAV